MDFIYLVSCAVNSEKPDSEKCAGMDLDAIYDLSRAHNLSAAAAYALEQVTELPHQYDQSMKKAIRKTALFNIERANVTTALESAGIWYLPLKGVILKEMYPQSAMREMSDNDLLCDSARMDDVKSIMEGLGFSCTEFGTSNHDAYTKPPMLEFEMHRSLFPDEHMPLFSEYFADIKQRLIPEGGSRCGYRMSDEDFYIYILCHLYKHYRFSGTGLRSPLDIYVFCRDRYESLDKGYLYDELDKLQLSAFENDLRELASKIFTHQPLNDAQLSELNYFITSGSYGTAEHQRYLYTQRHLKGNDSKRAKRQLLHDRIFLSGDRLKQRYPVVYRHRSLYPLLLVFRPIRGVFTHPKGIVKEYKAIKGYKKDNNHGNHN